jgi:hypothetical protein
VIEGDIFLSIITFIYLSLRTEIMSKPELLIKRLIEWLFANLLVIKRIELASLRSTITEQRGIIDTTGRKYDTIRKMLTKATSDAHYFAQEAVEYKKKLDKYDSEFADNILPTTGISFDKTVSNIKGMSSRARTTLLFRVVQILSIEEKEALNTYINYDKVNTKEEKAQGVEPSN